MARYSQSFFDIKQPLFVRKEFAGNDRIWLPGMLFDWKHFKIEPQRVRALFRSSYICHAEQESLEDAAVVVKPEEQQPTQAQSQQPEAKETAQIEQKYQIRHVGGPYYDVVSHDGKVVNHKSLHKSKAESYAEKLNSGADADETTTEEPNGNISNR